jgi:hypothetical protein
LIWIIFKLDLNLKTHICNHGFATVAIVRCGTLLAISIREDEESHEEEDPCRHGNNLAEGRGLPPPPCKGCKTLVTAAVSFFHEIENELSRWVTNEKDWFLVTR